MGLTRGRIEYSVGNKNNPGDPWGGSSLGIEPDGRARLDQDTLGGVFTWVGTVDPAALDRLWAALEEANFPVVAAHPIPAGSAMRALRIGSGSDNRAAYVAYHAAMMMPGYAAAFLLLDTIIRQISQDVVKVVPASDKIVDGVARLISNGTAFLLAYLPWRRTAHAARLALLDRNATTEDPELAHALDFSRRALRIEDKILAETDARLEQLAAKAGGNTPELPTELLRSSWQAGETARTVSVSAALLAHIAYLRGAAPDNAELAEQAASVARDLKASAARLADDLRATGLPLVVNNANDVPKMLAFTHELEPTTAGGYKKLNELGRDLDRFIVITVDELDVPPPVPPSAPPTAEEEALLARILQEPGNAMLRYQLSVLGARRGDPRAELIELQLSAASKNSRKARQIIAMHAEWTAPLVELGATKIKYAIGFPDEITIDADTFLKRGRELLAAAPLTRLHVRNAKGRVGEIVRSPLLATIEALDLDDQGVTDDDLIALATSPHAARLRQLDLRYNPISARGVEAIAASPYLQKLEVVALDANPADPVDQIRYYDETHTETVPTEAGKALEAKYGPLRWLRRR